MSVQTRKWLNTMTLIGHTAKRGNAWHYRLEEQEGEGNHFAGAVPLARAEALLDSPRLTVGTAEATVITEDGVLRVEDPTRKTIVRLPGSFGPEDKGAILGSHRAGYQLHGYGEWLLRNSEEILGHAEGELELSSVGLLWGGSVAWAQFEMPGNVTTASGVELAPFFGAVTSCSGTLATGYFTGTQVIVCDNTLLAADAQAERNGKRVKVRHTSGSLGRITDVREALQIVVAETARYREQIDALAARPVSPAQFETFLTRWAPEASDTKRAKTLAETKRGALRTLYRTDERVTPWTGTAFGVFQAVNTYRHHVKTVVGDTRYGRNMQNTLRGWAAKEDAEALRMLDGVLA